MRPSPYALLVLLTANASACAPRLSDLLQHRHYREALFLARQTVTDSRDDARVINAVMTELQPAIHLAPVQPAQLRPLFGGATDDVAQRLVILRLVHEATPGPLDGLAIEVALVTDKGTTAALPPFRALLCSHTGESEPKPRQVTRTVYSSRSSTPAAPQGQRPRWPAVHHWTLDTVRTARAVRSGVWDLFGLPFKMIGAPLRILGAAVASAVPSSSTVRETQSPTDRDWAAQAPVANALYHGLSLSQTWLEQADWSGSGRHLRWRGARFLVYPRPATPVRAIAVTLTLGARSISRGGDEGHLEQLAGQAVTIPLASGATLEQRIVRAFGAALRPLPRD